MTRKKVSNMNNYYDEWQQVPYDRKSPNYRGDLLPEWKKKEIRDSIAKAKAILEERKKNG
jgi:hypothetical protein